MNIRVSASKWKGKNKIVFKVNILRIYVDAKFFEKTFHWRLSQLNP